MLVGVQDENKKAFVVVLLQVTGRQWNKVQEGQVQ